MAYNHQHFICKIEDTLNPRDTPIYERYFGAISNRHLPMDTKIKVFSHISENCLKREVIEWGK